MEEVQEPVVAGRLQAQGAHDAGDAQQILASGESRQAEGHPQEGPGAGAGGALLDSGPMRLGSLPRKYKDPQTQAGAYWQITYTRRIKSRTEYVRREWVK